jgi:hypothetical protein
VYPLYPVYLGFLGCPVYLEFPGIQGYLEYQLHPADHLHLEVQ